MIGEKLRKFGIEKFGSVKTFAEALGMKPPTLQVYLRGISEPGANILRKLKNLGCDINWLLSEEEVKHGAVAERSQPYADYNNKIKELEEENRLLRDQLSEIVRLTHAVEIKYKLKKKRKL
jgi:transcriptional regulator with XRE-family HTH domain